MHLKPGQRAAGRPGSRFSIYIYAVTFIICKICQLGAAPRVRLAPRRFTSAVDMFARETAVTFTLISSGNAYHAVPRKWRLRRC